MTTRHRTTTTHGLDLDHVLGGVALLALHEADSLHGHAIAAHERVLTARQARSFAQLLREQRELLARSRRRAAENRRVRRELWRGLLQDLRIVPRRSA